MPFPKGLTFQRDPKQKKMLTLEELRKKGIKWAQPDTDDEEEEDKENLKSSSPENFKKVKNSAPVFQRPGPASKKSGFKKIEGIDVLDASDNNDGTQSLPSSTVSAKGVKKPTPKGKSDQPPTKKMKTQEDGASVPNAVNTRGRQTTKILPQAKRSHAPSRERKSPHGNGELVVRQSSSPGASSTLHSVTVSTRDQAMKKLAPQIKSHHGLSDAGKKQQKKGMSQESSSSDPKKKIVTLQKLRNKGVKRAQPDTDDAGDAENMKAMTLEKSIKVNKTPPRHQRPGPASKKIGLQRIEVVDDVVDDSDNNDSPPSTAYCTGGKGIKKPTPEDNINQPPTKKVKIQEKGLSSTSSVLNIKTITTRGRPVTKIPQVKRSRAPSREKETPIGKEVVRQSSSPGASSVVFFTRRQSEKKPEVTSRPLSSSAGKNSQKAKKSSSSDGSASSSTAIATTSRPMAKNVPQAKSGPSKKKRLSRNKRKVPESSSDESSDSESEQETRPPSRTRKVPQRKSSSSNEIPRGRPHAKLPTEIKGKVNRKKRVHEETSSSDESITNDFDSDQEDDESGNDDNYFSDDDSSSDDDSENSSNFSDSDGNSDSDDISVGYDYEDRNESDISDYSDEEFKDREVEDKDWSWVKAAYIHHLYHEGLLIKDVKQDGNGMFRAIADQIHNDEGMHTDVRQKCMHQIENNIKLYEEMMDIESEAYLSNGKQDGVDGDMIQLHAVADYLEREITVRRSHKSDIRLHFILPSSGIATGHPLNVCKQQNKYNSLIAVASKEGEELFKRYSYQQRIDLKFKGLSEHPSGSNFDELPRPRDNADFNESRSKEDRGGTEESLQLAADLKSDLSKLPWDKKETYRSYEMKREGQEEYYWGKVNKGDASKDKPCQIWSKCEDGSGYYTKTNLHGRWEYRGSWLYTSTGSNPFSAEISAKFSAAYRVMLCKEGRKRFPNYYPLCMNKLKRHKHINQLDRNSLIKRLGEDIKLKRNPSQIFITHSPLIETKDVTCTWNGIKHPKQQKRSFEVNGENPLLADLRSRLSTNPWIKKETYRTYEMKREGKEEYYWGKVNINDDFTEPCRIWSKCSDGSGYYKRPRLHGRWEYRGSWIYTSTGSNCFAAELSAKFAAAYRVMLCKEGRKLYPNHYPACVNRLKPHKYISQISRKELIQRLYEDIKLKRNPSQIFIGHSPLLISKDVTCTWIEAQLPYGRRYTFKKLHEAIQSYSLNYRTTSMRATAIDFDIPVETFRHMITKNTNIPHPQRGENWKYDNEKNVEKAVQLYNSKLYSYRDAAEIAGVGSETVRARLIELGTVRSVKEGIAIFRTPKPIEIDTLNKAVECYVESKMSIRNAAKEIGVGRQMLQKKLENEGLIRSKSEGTRVSWVARVDKTPLNASLEARIQKGIKYYRGSNSQKPMSYRDAAEKAKIGMGILRRRLEECGLFRSRSEAAVLAFVIPPDAILEAEIQKGIKYYLGNNRQKPMGYREAADKAGVRRGVLQFRLTREGLIRSRKESGEVRRGVKRAIN